MGSLELRQPVQKRAIEKKEKIIECGFKLMCEKGYHNVDCIQIANSAGVSTGTVYQYFSDKRDVFLHGLKSNSKIMLFPVLKYKNIPLLGNNTYEIVNNIINTAIKEHNISQSAHEEIMAMKHSDKEVNQIFKEYELEATNTLVQILKDKNIEISDIYEKCHLIIIWIDDLCHEIIYHKHNNLNYDKMKNIVIDSIVNLLKDKNK